jgi:hypothetical protein
MAVLLAEEVGRIVLIGNPDSDRHQVRHRLVNVARTMCAELAAGAAEEGACEFGSLRELVVAATMACDKPDDIFYRDLVLRLEAEGRLILTQDLGYLPSADVVVTATSAPNSLLGPRDLKHGSVVCDLSRPFNVSRDVVQMRPDVLVIDGGVIRVPGLPELGQFGIGKGHVFSCMAETILLTLDDHFQNTSLGADLQPETLRKLRRLACEHGFEVGGLRRLGVPLEVSDWAQLIEARQKTPQTLEVAEPRAQR